MGVLRPPLRPALVLVLMLLAGLRPVSAVDEAQERRVRGGLKLFRAVLSADEDIAGKTDSSGALLLLVVYDKDRERAEGFAEELRQLGKGDKRGTIRKLPIRVEVSNDLTFEQTDGDVPAGIYIVEPLYTP